MQPANASHRRRIEREQRTIGAMISIYCRGHHPVATDRACPECGELLAYAMARLDRCMFGGLKPVCANCTIHCYQPTMRERVRAVMRYAGPRMLVRHPMLSLWHQLDSRAAPPRRTRPEP